jgi:hypothetical protein
VKSAQQTLQRYGWRLLASALAVVIVGTGLVALWLQPDTLRIPDAGKPVELTLRSKHTGKSVYALHVEGRGQIDGAADISLVLNGQPYKTVRLKGPVRFSWREDWYAPEAVVRYTPLTATGGSIGLSYRFGVL